jgi:Uri superfamily endonuclease
MVKETRKGTYILILQLAQSEVMTIGRAGSHPFAAGWYTYVGSAFGAGGLGGRLKHHLSPVKRPHWHIDYLRKAAEIREIWYVASECVYEHQWAKALSSLPGAVIPVRRFGASDCKCRSHLVYLPARPDAQDFLARAYPGCAIRAGVCP